jgi:DNA-binding LacI/PurR family transcriptional regulator
MRTSEKTGRPPTSSDVARLAGVSRTTVSSILNGDAARFPEATRERVHNAAAQLKYQPSPAGRSLVRGRSDTIVVALPNSTFGSNFQDALDELAAYAEAFGGNVVVRFASTAPRSTVAAIRALRPLAVVNFGALSAPDCQTLEDYGTIVVPAVRDPAVTVSDGGIGQFQADVLLEGGKRNLWFAALRDTRSDPFGDVRFAALRAYCWEKKLPEPRRIDVPLTLEGAVESLERVVQTGEEAGIACFNDEVALALLAAARELEVRVPDQISVIGVDGIPAGQFWSPKLTSVRVDMGSLVQGLVAELQGRLNSTAFLVEPPPLHYGLVTGETV